MESPKQICTDSVIKIFKRHQNLLGDKTPRVAHYVTLGDTKRMGPADPPSPPF